MKKTLVTMLAICCIALNAGCGENTTVTAGSLKSASGNGESAASAPSQDTAADSYIGKETAKAAALGHAGLSETDVTFSKVKLESEDGRPVYEVEFYSAGQEYDYEIDAQTGEVLSFDHDAEAYGAAGDSAAVSGTASQITLDGAKAAALKRAGLSESEVTFTKTDYVYDNGLAVYEIEFISGDTEYDVKVRADTGAISEYSAESIYN